MNRTLPERIFISGFMGAGKSTIGKALAQKLEQDFWDLDDFIEQEAGKPISAIFEQEGEQAFRQKEQAAVLDIIRQKKGVIALGGGTLQNQHLLDHIKVNGLLVFIDTPMDKIISRIEGDKNRPLLLDETGSMKPKTKLKEDLQKLYEKRLPFYEQAEVTVQSTAYETREKLVNGLVKKIRYHVALH